MMTASKHRMTSRWLVAVVALVLQPWVVRAQPAKPIIESIEPPCIAYDLLAGEKQRPRMLELRGKNLNSVTKVWVDDKKAKFKQPTPQEMHVTIPALRNIRKNSYVRVLVENERRQGDQASFFAFEYDLQPSSEKYLNRASIRLDFGAFGEKEENKLLVTIEIAERHRTFATLKYRDKDRNRVEEATEAADRLEFCVDLDSRNLPEKSDPIPVQIIVTIDGRRTPPKILHFVRIPPPGSPGTNPKPGPKKDPRDPPIPQPKPAPSVAEALRNAVTNKQGAPVEIHGLEIGMIYIPVGDQYQVGLDRDRKYPVLAQKGFRTSSLVPSDREENGLKLQLLNPFLIMETEVTNTMYMRFLANRDAKQPARVPSDLECFMTQAEPEPLPPETGAQPVTDVTYEDARAFAAWIQAGIPGADADFVVRLPHELEWEMAARGSDSRQFPFSEDKQERAFLDSFKIQKKRSVGTNTHDRSWAGVSDVYGNVMEWTCSRFNPSLLRVLSYHLEVGDEILGWDPCTQGNSILEMDFDPGQKHEEVTVKGGANGQRPEFFMPSLRRRRTHTNAADYLGFRLIIVPREIK